MLKPKNISIRKIAESEVQLDPKRHRNSRKSLKMPKRETSENNKPSPVHLMKLDQSGESSSESDHGNFIACINGYLDRLDSHKSEKMKRGDENEIEKIKRKIQKEKSINRSMQKNFLELQRILWERTEKLERLEETLRRIELKENDKSIMNQNSHAKSRCKHPRKTEIQEISSEIENLQSEYSSGENQENNYDRYNRRRKTEMPYEIEKAISKTMALMPDHRYRRR